MILAIVMKIMIIVIKRATAEIITATKGNMQESVKVLLSFVLVLKLALLSLLLLVLSSFSSFTSVLLSLVCFAEGS